MPTPAIDVEVAGRTVRVSNPDNAHFPPRGKTKQRHDWRETGLVTSPSGRSGDELWPVDAAHLVWAVNLGCLDLNPWPVRRDDVEAWPPNFPKAKGGPKRVAPSRARKARS